MVVYSASVVSSLAGVTKYPSYIRHTISTIQKSNRSDRVFAKNRLRTCDGNSRAENLTRLEQLKRQLVELEKQYDKSKPLVNLVDNMVKLGSLYRNGTASAAQTPTSAAVYRQLQHQQHHGHPGETVTLDRLEFNQRMQERRQLHDEQKHWDSIEPNQSVMQVRPIAG